MKIKRSFFWIIAVLLTISAPLLLLSGALLKDGPFPPPVQISISQSKTPLRVYPGVTGVFFVLPNGSLWRWGQTGGASFSRARMPQQVGTDTDWSVVLAPNNHCLALRQNGTLWEWGFRGGTNFVNTPEQVGTSDDWIDIAAGDAHSVALRNDGTIWTWGNNSQHQLGTDGPGGSEMIQVGSDTNWMAVSCPQGSFTCALKNDGTFWSWGTVSRLVFPRPFQSIEGTNWVNFESDGLVRVRNRQGELWGPVSFPSGSTQSASASSFLISTNATAGRTAQAHHHYGSTMSLEVRADGTLWEAPTTYQLPLTPPVQSARTVGSWKRVGERSDWIGVWGSSTAIGLTADGTLWTWGCDPGLEPIMELDSQLRTLRRRIQSFLGIARGSSITSAHPPFRRTPTPLMKITTVETPQSLRGATPSEELPGSNHTEPRQ